MQCNGLSRQNKTYQAWIADDSQVPMVVLVDWNNDEIFFENVDFSRPPFDSVMPIKRRGNK